MPQAMWLFGVGMIAFHCFLLETVESDRQVFFCHVPENAAERNDGITTIFELIPSIIGNCLIAGGSRVTHPCSGFVEVDHAVRGAERNSALCHEMHIAGGSTQSGAPV